MEITLKKIAVLPSPPPPPPPPQHLISEQPPLHGGRGVGCVFRHADESAGGPAGRPALRSQNQQIQTHPDKQPPRGQQEKEGCVAMGTIFKK